MDTEKLRLFVAKDLPALCTARSSPADGYALPPATLECLRLIVSSLGVRRVFEFGSGHSTRLFLRAGCEVFSLEDSEQWLWETRRALTPEEQARWRSACEPLKLLWHRGAPYVSWQPTAAIVTELAAADLVLVDSPVLPPTREHALIMALRHARQALVVLDDANIPTVTRYCARLAQRNGLTWFQTPMDHGLCFFAPAGPQLDESRTVMETLRVWRFLLVRRRFQP